MTPEIPTIKAKNPFVESIERLSLRDILVLQTVLSERALYLNAKEDIDSKVIKPKKNLIHS